MKKVKALVGVYASGVKLPVGEISEISDNDFRILSGMKKVQLVEEAKAAGVEDAPKSIKKSVKKKRAK